VIPARWDDGRMLAPPALADKWWLVTVEAGACAEACERKLLLMRQVRLAQGKDQDRVERLVVLADASEIQRLPAPLTEGLRIARLIDPTALGHPFGDEIPADHIYLVDPLGRLMLSFPHDPDPKGMVRDLARLLSVNSWQRVTR
jgi:hypothetical protein